MDKYEEQKGPEFVRFFGPVIEALKELGRFGRPMEVIDKVATNLSISDDERNEATQSNTSKFANQVAWARFYLVKAAVIDFVKVWHLASHRSRSINGFFF